MPESDPEHTFLFVLQIGGAICILIATIVWPTPWNWAHYLGVAVAAPALFLLILARRQLGRSFSVTPQARQLVSTGIYSKVRNPIYIFSALLITGFLLVLQKPPLFLIFAVLIPMQVVRSRKEAKLLEATFGEDYRNYKRQTWF